MATPAERIAAWRATYLSNTPAPRDRLGVSHGNAALYLSDIDYVLAENGRLADAVERLHSLILRSMPNDGSEIPQPDDPWWRAQLDGVVERATEIYTTAIGS